MPFVHDLAQWIANFDAGALTQAARREAKLHLLDSIGCAFAALPEPTVRGTLAAVYAMGGAPDCTIIGVSRRTSAANAVLANGALIRTLDLNDMPHCSDHIPVALAVSEQLHSSGRDLLAAIVLGYEVQCRTPSAQRAGSWDSTSQSGIIAAAMAGWLRRLPVDTLADAIALSASHTGTLRIVRRGQLSSAKSIASSMGAHTGMVATAMAAEGVTGPPTALEEWAEAVLGGADLSPIIAPLDGEFAIVDVTIKAFPAVGTSQTAIAAALQVRESIDDPDDIDRVEAHMADIPFIRSQVMDAPERRIPATRETADHSFPFVIAVALRDGEFGLRQYEGRRWFDPAVRSLMDRITIGLDTTLNGATEHSSFPCRLRVWTRGGQEHTAEVAYAPGHPMNRMAEADVQRKFRLCTAGVVPESQQDAIIRAVDRLEDMDTVEDLMPLLAL